MGRNLQGDQAQAFGQFQEDAAGTGEHADGSGDGGEDADIGFEGLAAEGIEEGPSGEEAEEPLLHRLGGELELFDIEGTGVGLLDEPGWAADAAEMGVGETGIAAEEAAFEKARLVETAAGADERLGGAGGGMMEGLGKSLGIFAMASDEQDVGVTSGKKIGVGEAKSSGAHHFLHKCGY